MSGLMHKVKDAIHGGHKDGQFPLIHPSLSPTDLITSESAKLEHDGLQGEHGSQSGVHDTSISGSVAHGDSMSPTNPGVLNSTKRGIHGDRDTGTSGTGLSNQGLTGQTGTEGESDSVAHGSSMSPTNPGVLHSTKPGIHGARDAGTGSTGLSNSELMQDSGAGSGIGSGTGSGYDSASRDSGLGSGNNAGPQYTGTSQRDTGLVGSGLAATGRGTMKDESSLNAGSGSSYNPNDRSSTGLDGQDVLTGSGSNTRDTGLTGGTGSGYDTNSRLDRDNTTTGSGLGREDGLIAGGSVPQTGSGYDRNTRGGDLTSGGTGSGLTGKDSGIGSDYDSNTRGTGLKSGRTGGIGTGLTGGDSGNGSGYDSNTRGTGLTGGRTDGTDESLTGGDSGIGSGYDSNTRDTGLTGGGLSGTGSGLTSSHSGTGYDSNTRDTGLTGGATSGTGSGITGGDSGLGSGTGSSSHTGLTGKAEEYIEGSEKHHRGDGHPEDIVHPGHHYTQTAKALDPHLN